MLTVEEIEKIICEKICDEGITVDAMSAAQAIYEAQKAGYDPWEAVYSDGWNSTSFLQMRTGRLYREIQHYKEQGISVALCFVPGEGCGK